MTKQIDLKFLLFQVFEHYYFQIMILNFYQGFQVYTFHLAFRNLNYLQINFIMFNILILLFKINMNFHFLDLSLHLLFKKRNFPGWIIFIYSYFNSHISFHLRFIYFQNFLGLAQLFR